MTYRNVRERMEMNREIRNIKVKIEACNNTYVHSICRPKTTGYTD